MARFIPKDNLKPSRNNDTLIKHRTIQYYEKNEEAPETVRKDRGRQGLRRSTFRRFYLLDAREFQHLIGLKLRWFLSLRKGI
jgi:hypothetical protein